MSRFIKSCSKQGYRHVSPTTYELLRQNFVDIFYATVAIIGSSKSANPSNTCKQAVGTTSDGISDYGYASQPNLENQENISSTSSNEEDERKR